MGLPSNMQYTEVTGRFVRAVADGVDEDRLPDAAPLVGLSIVFEPDMPSRMYRNPTTSPPATVLIDPITCTTDPTGCLLGPDGTPGVFLVALDWSWRVTISGATFPRVSFSFPVTAGGVVDLSTVVPMPPNPGAQISAWTAVVSTAVSARDEAVAIREQLMVVLEDYEGGGLPADTTLDTIPEGATSKSFTATEKTKLAGVSAGATANASNAQLRDRSTHTGAQAIGTVTGLQGALDGKAASAHTHDTADVTGLSAALAGKAAAAHGHAVGDVSGLQAALDGKRSASWTPSKADVGLGNVANVAQIPATEKGAPGGVPVLDSNGLVETTALPAPTTTTRGAVRLATNAEAVAGTLDNTVITPATLAEVLGGLSKVAPYITTTGATLPTLPDGTIIGRYDPVGPLTPGVTLQGTVVGTGTGSFTVTTLSPIVAGEVLLVAASRGTTGTATGGAATVSTAAGALGTASRASAQRTGVAEVDIISRAVTTTIPAGTTLTIATPGNGTNRYAAAVYSVTNLSTATPDATSGDDAAGVSGASNAGQSANSTVLSPATDATTGGTNRFVFAAWAFNSSSDWAVSAPATGGADLATAAGTSDRGLLVGWKVAAAAGVQSVTAAASASGAVCGAIITLPITVA